MTPPALVDHDDDDDDHIFSKLNSDLARLDSEAEAILNSIRNETTQSSARASETCSSPLMNDSASDDDASSHAADSHDMHDDDEMNDEILRLGSVVASLQQDLDNTSVTTVPSTISTLETSPAAPERKRPTVWEFIQSKQLYGPGVGGQHKNTPLIMVNVIVWVVVVVLFIHVRTATLNEDGSGFTYLPTFGDA